MSTELTSSNEKKENCVEKLGNQVIGISDY